MTIYTTPIYGFAYCDTDTALVDLAAVTAQVAATAEAALKRGGIAPPAAQDLATLAGRVTTLEGRVTALERIGKWITDVETATTYNSGALAAAWANLPAGAGSGLAAAPFAFSVTVPAGMQLEVEFSAPLLDTPTGSGTQVRLLLGGAVKDAVYVSNSGSTSIAAPGRLHATVDGTGAAVAVAVQGQKVGSGSPVVQTGGTGPVIVRHRLVR